MQDRLAELRRQRDLVAEHLAWLEREIAAASPAAPIPAADPAPRRSHPAPPLPGVTPPADLQASDPADVRADVKRGCLGYFLLACALTLLAGALLVWLSQEYKRRHPAPTPIEQAPS